MKTPRWLVGLDIDETQIPERSNPHYFPGEQQVMGNLQASLNGLRQDGKAVVVHVSNGMRHLFDQVESILAAPDYITCSASTAIYKKTEQGWELDEGFQNLIESCHYDTAVAEQAVAKYAMLKQTGPEHQTALKRSYIFDNISLSKAERLKTFDKLQAEFSDHPGMKAFYVEGKMDENGMVDAKGPFATIDILPIVCTKGECIKYLAEKEGIDAGHIVVSGNGDNDISMFKREFRTIAVGNAQSLLKAHSQELASQDPVGHIIANGTRSEAVLEGLRHFGVL